MGLPRFIVASARRMVSFGLLAICSVSASAATLGGLTTSVGLFATLATLITLNGWLGATPTDPMSAAGLVLGLGFGAVLLWRLRRRLSARGAAAAMPRSGLQSVAGLMICDPTVSWPAEFQRTELLATARCHFMRLQSAWDAGNLETLRALTTPNVFDDLSSQLLQRGFGPNRTDVLTLDATLLGFDDLDSVYLVSIEFSGMIRERPDRGAAAFKELWMLTRPKVAASSWRLARQQVLL